MLLITGASGFLGANILLEARDAGRDVVGAFNATAIAGNGIRVASGDLSRDGAPEELLETVRPDWVLNCAALANVDVCERDPERAREINVELPRKLAASCREAGVRLLHVSTDSVFDGRRGKYRETDAPAPLNVYARTKLESEEAVATELPDALIVRTNFFGASPGGRRIGLADWIIGELSLGRRISGFTDVIFSPMAAHDLATVFFEMMDARLNGLFHAGASGSLSKFDFAQMLARELGLDESLVQRAKLADAKLLAPRPLDTSMDSSRAEQALGRGMPTIENSIARFADLRGAGLNDRLDALIAT